MPNTVRLHTIAPVQTGKHLAQVQAGTMSLADYRTGLAGIGVTAQWVSTTEYIVDFGSGGIKDPSGDMLTAMEAVEVVKLLLPPPHECAGALIRVQGRMLGVAGVAIARVVYASNLAIDTLNPKTGLTETINFPAEARDQVRIINPDTRETQQTSGDGWVSCRTSQIQYRRRQTDPAFDVRGVLLCRVEKSPRTDKWQASLFDGKSFAWCRDLTILEAV